MEEQLPPETLIKYYECNELNCDAIINNYLWAAHPLQFNDPFDCPFEAWDRNSFTPERIKKTIDPRFYKELGHLIDKNPRDQFIKFLHLFTGIICLNAFSDKNEDLLWGYYTHQKGFAVEFDQQRLSLEYNESPEKINYKNPSEFDRFAIPEDIQFADSLMPIFKNWIKQKKRIWENEMEWRYIFFDCNYNPCPEYGKIDSRKKKYTPDVIDKIILGFKFFDSCYLSKDGHDFIYDLNKDKNYSKMILLRHLFQKGILLFWINLKDKFQVEKVPIEIKEINSDQLIFNYKVE